MNDRPAILSMENVSFSYPGRGDVVRQVLLHMRVGECWGVIGPNGAGKSTLLRLAAGLLNPGAGRILLDGAPLSSLGTVERARKIAFLPQHPNSDFPLPALDVILMGRYPYRRFGLFENSTDREIAREVMQLTGTDEFQSRSVATLSGGEAQRVHIAAALAQQPKILLLDEPTASLDLHHQLGILDLLRNIARNQEMLLVLVTHDLNLAARYCSHVLLLDDGRCIASGPAQSVLMPDVLEPVYRVRLHAAATPDGCRRALIPDSPADNRETALE